MPLAIAPSGAELSVRTVGADEKVKRHLKERSEERRVGKECL